MAYNRKWVKTDGKTITCAPTWLMTDAGLVVNPSDEQYRAAGWMTNMVEPPSPPDGQMVASTRYVDQGDRVVAVYDYAPIPRAPRVISKLYLVLALKRRGLYDQFVLVVRAAQLEAEWTAAQDLSEDFPGFADYVAQFCSALGITPEQGAEIIDEAVAR